MRLAIFSDIHGNLEALAAADGLLAAHRIDEIVCLGDIVGYGANPNECIDYVRSHSKIVVRGNHDAAVVDPSLLVTFTRRASAAVEWTIERLSPENFKYLASLPLVEKAYECTFVHASPLQPDEWEYIVDPFSAAAAFAFFETPLCFFGHTHIPGIFGERSREASIRRGAKYMINPGSIGQPRDGNPHLSFGVLDTAEWTFNLVRSSYDIGTAAGKILQAGLPASLAERLSYGH